MSALTREKVIGVILAGGRSSRMGGGDKFLEPVGDTTMLSLVIKRLKPQLETLIISTNGDPARLAEYGLPAVTDPIEGYAGPLAGVLAAFNWAMTNQPEASHILTVAADTPFFPSNYADCMIAKAGDLPKDSIILATSNGRYHPIFGLWPIALRDDLNQALQDGMRKIRAWTDSQSNGSLDFENTNISGETVDPFFNVNEPADLARCIKLLEG